MSSTVTADDGTALPIDSLAMTFAYSGSFLSSISCVYPAYTSNILNTYVQTYDNDGTHITHISLWQGQNLPVGQSFLTDDSGNQLITETGQNLITG